MVVVHGQVHAAAGDAGLVREDGQRGLVLAVVPPVRARRCLCGDQISGAPRHRRAVASASARFPHGAARQQPRRALPPEFAAAEKSAPIIIFSVFLLSRGSETGGDEKISYVP